MVSGEKVCWLITFLMSFILHSPSTHLKITTLKSNRTIQLDNTDNTDNTHKSIDRMTSTGTEGKEEEKGATMENDRTFLQDLMKAAINGEGKKVKKSIIEYSIQHDIAQYSILKNFKDGSKRSAIHFACHSAPRKDEEVDIVELLLKKTNYPSSALQELVRLKDVDELTPLMIVCQNMNDKILALSRIKCILEIDPLSALVCSKVGATALHYAAGAGASKEVIGLLYEHGKEALNGITKQGSTPLHWASSDPPPKDYSETINAFLDLGADVDPKSDSEGGIPPLIAACASGNDVHAKLLVEHGADRGVILGGNVTIYHMAADLDLQATLKAMLDADADADTDNISVGADSLTSAKCTKMQNEKGETPLDLAAQRGHLKCFKLLAGEIDDEKATSSMTTLQKEWNEKRKDMPKDENKPRPIVIDEIDEESEAKIAAAKLLSNPSSVSEEDKVKAAEFKAQGNAHYVKGEWAEAIAAYTGAISLQPLDETYYSNRSACYLKLNKNHEALDDAVVCRYLKPTWVKGCFRLATARFAVGKYEDAAVSAWEGLNLDEGNSELETLVTKCIKKGRKEHLEKTKGEKK